MSEPESTRLSDSVTTSIINSPRNTTTSAATPIINNRPRSAPMRSVIGSVVPWSSRFALKPTDIYTAN